MKLVGLTGGIATGKTSIDEVFRKRGIPVIDADAINSGLLKKGTKEYRLIVKKFGKKVLVPTGKQKGWIDRQALGDEVFYSPTKKRQLEAILHPSIKKKALAEYKKLEKSKKHAYAVFNAAILLEADLSPRKPDLVILATAPIKKRLAWITSRNGFTAAYAKKIIASQLPEKKARKLANIVIKNDGSLLQLREVTRRIIDILDTLSFIEQFNHGEADCGPDCDGDCDCSHEHEHECDCGCDHS